MARIKGEFYTKKRANEAMDKIKKYCTNVQVSDFNYDVAVGTNGVGADYGEDERGYESFHSRYSFGMPPFVGFPLTSGFGLGDLSMDWTTLPFEYANNMYDISTPKAVLEADVIEGNYNLVKDKLYLYGATGVY